MKLYLVRHGDSLPTGSDDERPLSKKGEKEIFKLANFIAPLKIQVSRIFQSPKRRAQQTAKILSAQIILANHIETRSELAPNESINLILDEIYVLNEDILMVGHMPFMGKFVSKLITGDENKDVVSFKTGCMLCLEQIADGQWVIRWMLIPQLF